jgi:hypothetical protein
MTLSEGGAQSGIATSILKSVSGMVEGWLLYRWVWRNSGIAMRHRKRTARRETNKYDKWHGLIEST